MSVDSALMSLGRHHRVGFEFFEHLKRVGVGLFSQVRITGAVIACLAVVTPGIIQAEEKAPAAPAGDSTPAAAPPKPATGVEVWFAQVDGPQQEAFQKQVVHPYEASLADLRTRYLAALDAAMAKASTAGRLDEALAYRAERQAFEKAQAMATDGEATPAAVKTLRATFHPLFTKLDQDRTAKAKTLFADYDAILAKNQLLLTQHQRLDEAVLLKTKRDEIARAWLGTAQPTNVAAAAGPASARPAATNALHATKDVPFVNTLGMKFVPVPGTEVLFSVWDTRVQDYTVYVRGRKADDGWTKQQMDGVPVSRDPEYPVVGVNWDEARGFCRWLTDRETADGKLPKGMKYRLPTDEEWSRAAGLAKEDGATPKERSEKNQVGFPWGAKFPPAQASVGNYADTAYHEKFPKGAWLDGYTDGYATTSPVGHFPANEYGLYDMGGNVWQWCEDYYDPESAPRVLRGASWRDHLRDLLLSSGRTRSIPSGRGNHFGFRCVLGTSDPALDNSPNNVAFTGTPDSARPPSAPAPLPAPGTLATTSELVKTYRNSLVFVTGSNGSGSGFLANYGAGTVLFTNAHVAAGVKSAAFKTLDGTEVKIGAASCAVGHDVFLMQATTSGKPLEIMKGVDENAAIGDEVVVLGNAEGAGVINTITGKIVGLGPQLVEVDAAFQPGNSGSPIIHLKSGKVIGVATYAIIRKYDPSTKEPVKEPVIRRFGYRLDSVKSWQPVNWPAFSTQATEMEAIEKLTGDLANFLDDLAHNGHVTRGANSNPVIKNRIDSWLDDRAKRLSPRDAAMADQSFLSFLKITCQNDVTAARQHLTYDYFQRGLVDQQRERNEISGVFDEIIQNLGKRK